MWIDLIIGQLYRPAMYLANDPVLVDNAIRRLKAHTHLQLILLKLLRPLILAEFVG